MVAFILPELRAVCDHGFPIVHPCQYCREAEPTPPPGEPFLPRPPEGWGGFNGGTDPNGVPWCPVDVPLGWECPRCRTVWNPSVLACHHCPVPPSFIAKGDDPGPAGTG